MSQEVSITKTSDISRELKFSVPEKEFLSKIDSTLSKIAQTSQLKGFRQGKAPVSYVKKIYGDKVKDDVIMDLARTKFSDAIEKNKIKVVGTFNLAKPEYKEGSDLNLSATLEVYPEITADDYKKFSFKYDFQESDKDFLELCTEGFLSRYITFRDPKKSEVITDKDKVEVESNVFHSEKGKKGEEISDKEFAIAKVIFVDSASKDYPEIHKALSGQKTGTLKPVKLTLPKEHVAEELQGKEVIVEIEVKSFQKEEKPELDEEFIERETGLKTRKDFDKKIEEISKLQAEQVNSNNQRDAFLECFIKTHEFEVPSFYVNNAIRENMYQSGMLKREDEWTQNVNFDNVPGIDKEPAIKEIKKWIILNHIIEKESIECSEEEVLSWLEKENIKRTSYDFKEKSKEDIAASLEFMKMSYGYPKNMEGLKREVSLEKAFELVLSTCQMTKNKITK